MLVRTVDQRSGFSAVALIVVSNSNDTKCNKQVKATGGIEQWINESLGCMRGSVLTANADDYSSNLPHIIHNTRNIEAIIKTIIICNVEQAQQKLI